MPFVLAKEISHLALLSHLFRSGNKVSQLVDVRLQEELLKKPLQTNQWNTAPFEVTGFCFLKEKSLFSFLVQALLVDIGAVKSKKEAKELVCHFVKRESTSDVTRRIDSNMTRTAFSQS